MKKFIGKINDRVYSDETVFQYALNDIIGKGQPFTSSSECVEITDEREPEDTSEDCCCKNGECPTCELQYPDLNKIGSAYAKAEDKDEFLDQLERELNSLLSEMQKAVSYCFDIETLTDAKARISDERAKIESNMKSNDSRIDSLDKQYTDADNRRDELLRELKSIDTECKKLLEQLDYEEGAQIAIDMTDEFYTNFLRVVFERQNALGHKENNCLGIGRAF